MYAFEVTYFKNSVLYFKMKQCRVIETTKLR